MLLVTGPAGSGKTHFILERLREALRRRDAGVRLLTPTATMARHVQNGLAREGFVFRPALIQTLSRFVDGFAQEMPQVSRPLFYLAVEEAVRRVDREEFRKVGRLPGFCAALARTMDEFASAGCDAALLAARLQQAGGRAPLGEAFLAVYAEVGRDLRRRGLFTRSQRLLRAAETIARDGAAGLHTIWLDGFYALPDPELAVIDALRGRAELTLTLPSAPVTEPTRARLLAMGFTEQACTWQPAPVFGELVEAPSIEREADEIARRILEQAAAGRPFRDMGVVVRSPEVYEDLLRATLDRFAIPARFYFDADLERHPMARLLAGVVDALLGGWDHAETLAALGLAPGVAHDAFDFAVRERLPGRGLEGLRSLAGAPTELLDSCARLEEWRELALAPSGWAERLGNLRAWFPPPKPADGAHEMAALARGQAAALNLFDEAAAEAVRALPERPVALAEFWRTVKSILRLTPLRVSDNRRNVVHVLDAHEARQWRLPVVFVCGLVEKQFPKFHTQDFFFPEAARQPLTQAGIRVRTAGDFEMEERFLFDWAVARATESLTMSYPRTDARGQPNLPSMYLDGMSAVKARPGVTLRRGAAPAPRERTAVTSPALLQVIGERFPTFQTTSLEVYLQCPFQFFGRDTLRLRGAPLRPGERLDYRTQGSVVHAVLAALHREGLPVEELFEREFQAISRRNHIVPGYLTESLRERMLADLRGLVEDARWRTGNEVRAEQEFRYALAEGLSIRGRIDRFDVTPGGGALVIDYKYSRGQGIKDRAHDENLLQPQLYMRAVEQCFGRRPEGMAFWGFKGGIQLSEWIAYDPAPAVETAKRAVQEIRGGKVAPQPADTDKCRLCDFRDACRFAAAEAVEDETPAKGAADWD